MEFWLTFLPIVIYSLLIIILVMGIILGVKSIKTINKVEKIVDGVNEKVNSFRGFLNIIDFTTDKIASFSDKIVDGLTDFITRKIFHKKKKKSKEEEDYE